MAARTPSFSTLDNTLSSIYSTVKTASMDTLRTLHHSYARAGYVGGFCNLQLDLTTVANQEYCTASASFLKPDSAAVEHLSLATKVFPGSHKEADIARWIEEVRTAFKNLNYRIQETTGSTMERGNVFFFVSFFQRKFFKPGNRK